MNRDKISEYFNSYTDKKIAKFEINNQNFYYLYELETISIKDIISNTNISPVCLIVESESKEYYLYSLNEEYDNYIIENKEKIVKYFVKTIF